MPNELNRAAPPGIPVGRRAFLKGALAAAGLCAARPSIAIADQLEPAAPSLLDVNVSLGRWPTRQLALDEPERLVEKLRSHGVMQAWAGSFDALLHKDLSSVNQRLTETCRRFGLEQLKPFGSVNPAGPDWEEDLRRCAEDYRMPGIRLYPNYHGYALSHPALARLLERAAQRGLIVQMALLMEDERMMHPLLQVPPVDTAPLASLVKQLPALRLVLVNALRALRAKPLLDCIAAGQVYVEISGLEGVEGIARLLEQVPAERVLFGSHAPFFYLEAALLKLRESLLSEKQRRLIQSENAQRLASFAL